MPMHFTTREPERDAELARLLRGLEGEPPADVDWEGLRASVAAQAELPLARRRRRPWLGGVAGRVRAVVPLAAAASIAAGILALELTRTESPALSPEDRALVEQIVEASVPEQVDALISGEADGNALLEAAVGS
ncbi:MAG TPA: hypothetical protein VFX98_00040 [Longimicrobiaceae bacterium]|nr:hypothetical protein [Longimicrobiaceae bacterium]